ncbi:MAG TPA: hypothetical protein VFP17_01800 [Solirubrobacterales bacterium]|nr:hypothetical protein [Solirubrobacterales bacterium]
MGDTQVIAALSSGGGGQGLEDNAKALGQPQQRRQFLLVGFGLQLEAEAD